MVNGEQSQVNADHSPPVKMSQAAIGRALDLAPATMTKLKGQGMPVDSVESARAWRIARQNVAARKAEPVAKVATVEKAALNGGLVSGDVFRDMIRTSEPDFGDDGPDEDHQVARTRREIAEANIAEIKEAELKGRYIEKTAVDRAVFEAARGLRDGLTNCSRRMAAEVAALSTPNECEIVIAKELRHLLEAFTRQLASRIIPINEGDAA